MSNLEQVASSNFNLVLEFSKTFGVPVFDTPQKTIFDDNPQLVNLRMNLIREEVKELEQGVQNKDLVEVADALADILYVVYGMGASLGLDMDLAMRLVHKSNMSKACKDEQGAIETVEWYRQEYEQGRQPYDSPAYRQAFDIHGNSYWVIYNSSTGKILKSIYYTPVDLDHDLVNKS